MNNIFTSKSGNIVHPNKHAFNHKLFHIYNYAEITKILQTCLSRLVGSPTDPFIELRLCLSFNFILCSEFSLPHPEFSLMSNLIYNLLLLFIGNLKIASTWIDRLSIKDCNNYLPNNLASKINSTRLHCRIMDSTLLSNWSTRS